MTDTSGPAGPGWFADVEPGDIEGGSRAIIEGATEMPQDWPGLAVETGFAETEDAYYEQLNEVAVHAARELVTERARAPDQQLIHSVRAMDDCARTANELAERVAEWAGALFDEAGSGIEYARQVATREPGSPFEERAVALAERIAGLADERDALRAFVAREAPAVAPNLSALAGPVLAARLIALAGSLKTLARKPSGTLQVLGAEDALFAHLSGRASSPKHGVIYTHEYVRGTARAHRGSAARALAGKLSLAARVDYYSGERKPELDAALDDRIERIRARGDA